MNKGNLNRNGSLVLGLCFGLFLASAAQCESKKKSDLNGYKQKSNSDRGPSNSSGSNDGGGYRNPDGSSGEDNDRKKAIEEGIEIVTKALKAMQGQVKGYAELEKQCGSFYLWDYRYYKACRSLFIELDKDLWYPKGPQDSSSSWEQLCYYVNQGNADEVLKILGFHVEKKRNKQCVIDCNKDNRLESLLSDCSKILDKQDGSKANADDSVKECCKSSLLVFRKAFAEVYQRLVLSRSSPRRCFHWKPEGDLDQLVKNLDNIQSGLVKIFGDEFINLDREKLRDLDQVASYWFWRGLVDLFSSQLSGSLWFFQLIKANYDDTIAFAKKLPDCLKKAD